MKRSEMNEHQKAAFDRVCAEMSEIIGANENNMMDYPVNSEAYQQSAEFLSQPREVLIDYIYSSVMAASDKKTEKHLRFAGKKFIVERIDRRLAKWGY